MFYLSLLMSDVLLLVQLLQLHIIIIFSVIRVSPLSATYVTTRRKCKNEGPLPEDQKGIVKSGRHCATVAMHNNQITKKQVKHMKLVAGTHLRGMDTPCQQLST